jgi:hypothetical protein
MVTRWFAPFGWVYRPCAWQGYAVMAVALVFCAQAFLAIDRHTHSVSDTLFGFFPFVVPAFLLVNWVASKSCGPPAG